MTLLLAIVPYTSISIWIGLDWISSPDWILGEVWGYSFSTKVLSLLGLTKHYLTPPAAESDSRCKSMLYKFNDLIFDVLAGLRFIMPYYSAASWIHLLRPAISLQTGIGWTLRE